MFLNFNESKNVWKASTRIKKSNRSIVDLTSPGKKIISYNSLWIEKLSKFKIASIHVHVYDTQVRLQRCFVNGHKLNVVNGIQKCAM